MGLVSELRRRNVFRVAIAYALIAWIILEAGDVLAPALRLPDWVVSALVFFLVLGFPLALVLAWAFELTPEGIRLEKHVDRSKSITHITGRKLDYLIIAVLAVALVFFAFDEWVLEPSRNGTLVDTTTGAESEPVTDSVEDGLATNGIAVMAFADLSPEGDQEYFSDGISEEILNALAHISELHVISRSSSFSFKGKGLAIPTIARQLGVANILEGSVRKSGDQVRITVQLIDARTDAHVWSATYNRDLVDIFAVQDEIAGAISDALKTQLALDVDEAVQPAIIMSANTEAYDAYLRGRELIRLRGQGNLEEAVRHLERSLRLDERFAPAHAQLAIATTLLSLMSGTQITSEDARRVAIPHLDRAQELEPDLAEAHGGRALLELYTDQESAVEHARKALASNPTYIDAMNWLAMALGGLGRYEERDTIREQELIIDPLSLNGRYNHGYILCSKGRVEEAHEIADRLLVQSRAYGYALHAEASYGWEGKLAEGLSWMLRAAAEGYTRNNQDWVRGYVWVGEYDEARRVDGELAYMVDVAEGRFQEAIQATQRRMQLDPDNVNVIAAAANVLYAAGRIDEALPLYDRLRDFGPEGQPVPWDYEMDVRCHCMTMRLALARRKAGDEDGAQVAVQIVRKDQAARYANGRNNQYEHRTEAMIAAFENNPEGVITALRSAIQLGLRDLQVFDDAIFEDFWDEPRFIALQQELEAILVEEHNKVLQLICFNNPTPENWQPLPETCEGVLEQRVF